MNILTLDSSQLEASLALFSNDKKVREIHYSRERRLSMYLVYDISKITQENKSEINEIDYFALTIGPGSYTGLRIGLMTIKTLAWSLQKPIIPISTLHALAYTIQKENTLMCPMIDARQNEIYGAGFLYRDGQYTQKIQDNKYAPSCFLELVKKEMDSPKNCIFLGDGALLYKHLLNDYFIHNGHTIDVSHIHSIAQEIIRNDTTKILTEFQDLEPNYCGREFGKNT